MFTDRCMRSDAMRSDAMRCMRSDAIFFVQNRVVFLQIDACGLMRCGTCGLMRCGLNLSTSGPRPRLQQTAHGASQTAAPTAPTVHFAHDFWQNPPIVGLAHSAGEDALFMHQPMSPSSISYQFFLSMSWSLAQRIRIQFRKGWVRPSDIFVWES